MSWPEERGDWIPYLDEAPPPPPPPQKKVWAIISGIISWIVILLVVAFLVYRISSQTDTLAADQDDSDAKELLVIQIQGRLLVGAYNLEGRKDKQYADQAASLNVGPPAQRLAAVVLIGELANAAKAREKLSDLIDEWDKDRTHLTEKQHGAVRILWSIYTDFTQKRFDAPSVDDSDREALIDELGWFGNLALNPPESPRATERNVVLAPAYRSAVVAIVLLLVTSFLFLVGSVGLLVLPILAFLGYVRGGLGAASPYAAIYAETFALWLVVFLGMSWAASMIDVGQSRLLLSSVGMLISLSVLGWPVLRGIPWRQVRVDIGWTAGRLRVAEPFFGLASLVLSVPLLVVGLIASLILVGVKQLLGGADLTGDAPVHPIVQFLQNPSPWLVVQVFFAASVVAPIVEETMFRGVLYRQLRSATGYWGFAMSFLASAVVVSFIFALIHPQGWVAAPALMGVALALTIAREWRVTLLPGMLHHGIHNACLLTVALLFLN
jgi:membrane protease YdiL (CAAX protease family)